MTADVCMWHTKRIFDTCVLDSILLLQISIDLRCNLQQATNDTPDYSESKNPPVVFWHFSQTVRIFNQLFTHLLQVYVPTYAILQIFIHLLQLWLSFAIKAIWLCHIEHDYLVHIICSKCPPSAEKDASDVTFANVTIALLIVICGKSSQIFCCSVLFSSGMVFRFDWSLWNAWSIAPHRW